MPCATSELEVMQAQLALNRLKALEAATESPRARRQLKATADELFRIEEQVATQRRDLSTVA